MISKNTWRHMLYTSIALITIIAVLLTLIVIPSVFKDTYPGATPDRAIPAIAVSIILHLLIVAAILWTLRAESQGKRINKELLVASGIVPIVLGLVLLDGAFAYLNHPDMLIASKAMFVCVLFDLTAGILVFFTRYSFRPNKSN